MKGLRGRRRPADREARIIAIALEGEKTGEEHKYFTCLGELLQRPFRYEIHLLPTTLGRSSPNQVLDRMIEFEQEHHLEHEIDRVWLVFDRDTSEQIGSVTNDATRRNYGIAASNPCFELWLLLHHEDVNLSSFGLDDPEARDKSQRLKKRVREIRASGHLQTKDISADLIHAALARARALVPSMSDPRFPPCPGTFVYKIIEDLQQLQLFPEQANSP